MLCLETWCEKILALVEIPSYEWIRAEITHRCLKTFLLSVLRFGINRTLQLAMNRWVFANSTQDWWAVCFWSASHLTTVPYWSGRAPGANEKRKTGYNARKCNWWDGIVTRSEYLITRNFEHETPDNIHIQTYIKDSNVLHTHRHLRKQGIIGKHFRKRGLWAV